MIRTIKTCPEVWLPVVGYEGYYEVSSTGLVKNSRYNRPIKSHPDKNGYLRVRFFIHGVKTKHFIHRLVANAFLINPDKSFQVNHKDGIKINNSASNLEWVSSRQNIKHAIDIGLRNSKGSANYFSFLNEEKVSEIKKLLSSGEGIRSIAEKFGVQKPCVWKIKKGMTWQHVL